MKRVPTSLEFAAVVGLSIFGLFLLYKSTTDQTSTDLMCGAVCFALGMGVLFIAAKNSLSNRQVFRHSVGRGMHRNSNSE